MSPKKPDPRFEYSGWDAWSGLFSSLTFLVKHPKSYGAPLYIVLLIVSGVSVSEVLSHATGFRIEMSQPAAPITTDIVPDQGDAGFSIFPYATAQDKSRRRTIVDPNAIILDGQPRGWADPNWRLFKDEFESRILVWSVKKNRGLWWEADPQMFNLSIYETIK